MAHILLLEDDPILGRGLTLSLELEGFEVSWASDLRAASKINESGPIDLFLLDWNLPDGTGLDFCRTIRERSLAVPIIFLTAKTDEETAIAALQGGANDFVRKPFGQRELFARIRAALKLPLVKEEQLRLGNLLVLMRSRRVLYNKAEVELNRREFDILVHLVRHADAVVTREELLQVIDKDGEIYDRTVDSHLSHLRTRLKAAKVATIQISSVYGVGYRISKVGE